MNHFSVIKAGAALAALVLLASCDPDTCGFASVVNKSGNTIRVHKKGAEAVTLAPDQVMEGNYICGVGMGQEPGQLISDLDKVSRDTTWCTRNIQDARNWTTTKAGKFKFEHRFVVSKNDF